MAGTLVEDPRGGAILIGGNTGSGSGTTTSIYRLEHAGSQWTLMTQHYAATFLIPDSLAPNCTLN